MGYGMGMEMIYRGGRTEAVAGDSWTDSPSAAWQYARLDHDGTITITVARTAARVEHVDGIDVVDTDTRDLDELRRVLGSDAAIVAYADTIPGYTVGHTCYRQMADTAVEIAATVTLPASADWDDVDEALYTALEDAGLI